MIYHEVVAGFLPPYAYKPGTKHAGLSPEARIHQAQSAEIFSVSHMKDWLHHSTSDWPDAHRLSRHWMTALNQLLHFLAPPLPGVATRYSAVWVSCHISTARCDHLLCADSRFFTPHNMVLLDEHHGYYRKQTQSKFGEIYKNQVQQRLVRIYESCTGVGGKQATGGALHERMKREPAAASGSNP